MRLLTPTEYESLVFESVSYDDYKKSISKNIQYHIENGLSISESIFRIGSDSYHDFINEMRSLHEEKKIKISEEDQFILERLQTGKKGIYIDRDSGRRRTVDLDEPRIRRDSDPGKSLFIVYRPAKSGKKDEDTGLPIAVALGFGEDTGKGQPDVRQKHKDEGARKQFLARHNCKDKKDLYSSGWWSCNIHKWWKQLGLSSDDPW